MPYDIITLGAATYDVFISTAQSKVISSKRFATGLGECFALGSKVEIEELFFDTGGGATNAAVTFQHLGFSTGVLTKIGKDIFGSEVVRVLQEAGVSTDLVLHDSRVTTDFAVVLVATGGERSILIFRGASAHVKKVEVNWDQVRQAKSLYISSMGGNRDLLERAMQIAREQKQFVAVNPGSKELAWGLPVLKKIFKDISIFIINREEAALLLNKPYRSDVLSLLRDLSTLASNVVITDGAQGAYVVVDAATYSYAPALGHKVANTTGAGDGFASAFTAGYLYERDAHYALRLGILNSGMVVTKVGAKRGILTKLPKKSELTKLPIRILHKDKNQ